MADEVIVYTTIDEDFPVAGQDNDSQGFRDNFSVVKTGLSTANTEILALKNNAAKLNVDNDFGENNITNANLVANTLDENNTNVNMNGGESAAVDWSDGAVYNVSGNASAGAIGITLQNFPTTNAGSARVVISTANTSNTTFTFNAGIGQTLKTDGNAAWTSTALEVTNTQTMIVDVFTTDGVTYYLTHVGTYS